MDAYPSKPPLGLCNSLDQENQASDGTPEEILPLWSPGSGHGGGEVEPEFATRVNSAGDNTNLLSASAPRNRRTAISRGQGTRSSGT